MFVVYFLFFNQKAAYEMRISDWSSDVCSSDLALRAAVAQGQEPDLEYPNLAQLLRRAGVTAGSANQRDMRELFRRMVFNILIDNTDDHEKNHALMVVEDRQSVV